MLPIGINSDEDKLYRRTFRSGVLMDRWNYILLLQLRDLCLAQVDQCAVDEGGVRRILLRPYTTIRLVNATVD